MVLAFDVAANRGSRFPAILIATGSQRAQFAQFESQGQKPFESLTTFFTLKTGFKSRDSIHLQFRIARSVIRIMRFETSNALADVSLY